MNKTELVAAIAEKTKLSKKDAEACIDRAYNIAQHCGRNMQ